MLLFPVQAAHCHLFMRVFFFLLAHLLPSPPPSATPPHPTGNMEIVFVGLCVHMNMRAYLTVRFCVEIFKRLSSALHWMQTSAGASSLAAARARGSLVPSRQNFFSPPALSLCASALLTVNHLFPSLPYFPRTQHYLNGHFASCH